MGRLGLGLGLESGLHVVGWLGSRVWVTASFHIFALTLGAECLAAVGMEIVRWGNVRDYMSEGENVLRSCIG